MILFHLINLTVDFFHALPIFRFDAAASLAEQMNHFAIVISESCHCDLDLFDWLVFEAEIWKQREPALHLLGDPVSEGVRPRTVHFATVALLLLKESLCLFVQPLIEEVWVNIELDGIITSRDRLDVPLDIAELLVLADIVKVVDDE